MFIKIFLFFFQFYLQVYFNKKIVQKIELLREKLGKHMLYKNTLDIFFNFWYGCIEKELLSYFVIFIYLIGLTILIIPKKKCWEQC